MAAWIACALCALVIVKPQEFVGALAGLPLLYVAFAATVAAVAADLVRRRIRLALAPQLPFIFAFFAWALLVTAVKRPDVFGEQLLGFGLEEPLRARLAAARLGLLRLLFGVGALADHLGLL